MPCTNPAASRGTAGSFWGSSLSASSQSLYCNSGTEAGDHYSWGLPVGANEGARESDPFIYISRLFGAVVLGQLHVVRTITHRVELQRLSRVSNHCSLAIGVTVEEIEEAYALRVGHTSNVALPATSGR